ncbi:MAG: hypothetical protein ACK5KL_03285 [Dysgonomonas sp.]|jgi:hypothetical protein|nr:hypothetical protein [Prevotella sp.]
MRNTLKKSDISISNRIDSFYEFIEEKIKGGWKRNDVYLFVEEILNDCDLELEIADAIYEFKTSLIGDAAPASIFRFEGDPEDNEDLAKYVRSYVWKDS